MKKAILIFFIGNLAFIANAQNVNLKWAKQMGGTGRDNGTSITVDAAGNVYTTGVFESTVDFDPGPVIYNLTFSGGYDMFISKLDAAGNFVWAKQVGGNSSLDGARGCSITLDAYGNIYTTGYFRGVVDFDPGPGVFTLSTVDVNYASFVSKLDAAGNFVWAKQMGGGFDELIGGRSIATDAAGNVYTSGVFQDIGDFDPGPGIFSFDGGYSNIYISKLDAGGNFIWARAPEHAFFSAGIDEAYIALDATGNIYCTGDFWGIVDFDPGVGAFSLNSVSTTWDIYVWKLTADGNFVWARQFGGSGNESGFSIVVDPFGNVYTTGYFENTVDFDPGSDIYNLVTSGNYEVFVLKLNPAGNFVWAKQMDSIVCTMPGQSLGWSIALDVLGNVYIAGQFYGTVDFDPGIDTHGLTANGADDVFIFKLDMAGNFMWAKQMGGDGRDYVASIAVDAAGNIYTTGAFKSIVDFDPGPGIYNLGPAGDYDIFVDKMSKCTSSTSAALTITDCKSYTLNGFTYTTSGVYTQTISNIAGCDSIITLNLTINRVYADEYVSACNNYTWHCHTYNNCNNTTTQCLTYNSSGVYIDTVITANACDSIITLHLTITHPSSSVISQTICMGQSYNGHSASGTYIDTVISADGCESITELQLTVLPEPSPRLGIDTVLCTGDSLRLYPGQFTTYAWQDGSAENHITVKHPGLYAVVVTDNCGSARDEIMIGEANCAIYFPTAFTPNNDGKNDWFKILGGYNVKEYHLVVYNRWGQKVFETFDYAKGWDGTCNGKLQPSATFVWYCEFIKPGSTDKTKIKGTVTLIR